MDLAAKPLQSNRVSQPRPASFPLKMPIDLTTLTKNNSCVYSCSFLNLTISLEINGFFQIYFFFLRIKFFSFGSARSNREKIMRLTNKTNIFPDELSKFLISHRELKRGGPSPLGKKLKSYVREGFVRAGSVTLLQCTQARSQERQG